MNKSKKYKLQASIPGQTILDALPQIAYVFNKQKQMVMWNKNCEAVLGYTADELYLKHVDEFIEEETIEENHEAIRVIFSQQKEQSIEQNLLTKSGEKIQILDTANYATLDGEEYLIGMAIDISQLKATEEKLQSAIVELHQLKEMLQAENVYLREEYKGQYNYDVILGESMSVLKSIERMEQVAPTETTVLLKGEAGTHRELFARVIHNKSKRRNKALIKADCSGYSTILTESDLFGHVKGAHSTALQNRIGKIELAHRGTLFLYEIGELTMDLQNKLYRVLTEGMYERMGSSTTRKADLRVIASTKYDIEDLIKKGLFREDLFYNINIFPISIAPLRDRIIDIPLLAQHYLDLYNQKFGRRVKKISKKTMKEMQEYSWPGNIRELENVVERAVIVSKGSLLKIEPFVENRRIAFDKNLLSLSEHEKTYIIEVLEKTHWRVEGPKGAARILAINPETLRSRMRKLGIKRS
jgi:PAS domain S-box-containing protein